MSPLILHRAKLFAVGLIAASLTTVCPAGSIYQPAGLSPGDQYRLAFSTSTRKAPTSEDIAEYNAFVTAEATAAGNLVADLDTEWAAIASTPSVDAIDNTGTDPSAPGATGVPIYSIDGVRRIANDYDDLWDGSVINQIYDTPLEGFSTEFVWTGTGSDGTALHPLGGETVGYGLITTFGPGWTAWGDLVLTDSESSFYGISGVLTVPIPEPSAALLVGSIFLGLVSRRRFGRPPTHGEVSQPERLLTRSNH